MAAPLSESPNRPGSSSLDYPKAPAEEIDVWWGSYAGRAMLPGFLLCLLLTLLLLALDGYLIMRNGPSETVPRHGAGVRVC